MSLLQMSFYGAVLIVAILIIRAIALHRLPKKVFILLWSIALLRLLVPFSIPSEFSLYSVLPVELLAQTMVPATDTFIEEYNTAQPTPLPSPDKTTVTVVGLSSPDGTFLPLATLFRILGSLSVALFFLIT